jgi:hypothetical protein
MVLAGPLTNASSFDTIYPIGDSMGPDPTIVPEA